MGAAVELRSGADSASLPPDQLVVGVREVARMLNRTPTAVYRALNRQADWLPRPFKMGQKLCWYRTDVENHVKMMSRNTV